MSKVAIMRFAGLRRGPYYVEHLDADDGLESMRKLSTCPVPGETRWDFEGHEVTFNSSASTWSNAFDVNTYLTLDLNTNCEEDLSIFHFEEESDDHPLVFKTTQTSKDRCNPNIKSRLRQSFRMLKKRLNSRCQPKHSGKEEKRSVEEKDGQFEQLRPPVTKFYMSKKTSIATRIPSRIKSMATSLRRNQWLVDSECSDRNDVHRNVGATRFADETRIATSSEGSVDMDANILQFSQSGSTRLWS